MIYYANSNFNDMNINPYQNNQPYTNDWILLKLIDDANFKLFTGGGTDGIFQLVITKQNVDWAYRIYDFIQYETESEKNIIIAVDNNDLSEAKEIYSQHTYKDKFLRPYEQKVLMHSTTKENYNKITADGCLKSWALLKSECRIKEETPTGSLLGDPLDYSKYIMFTNGGISAERVVASKQKGFIEMNIDTPYLAGARLYFDAEKIAKDGLLIRDGAHLKVKDKLVLQKYLIWTATPEILGISMNTTPRIFAETADKIFTEKYGIELPHDTHS